MLAPPPPPPPAAFTQNTVRVRNDVSLRKESLRLEATAAPNRFALRFAVDARQCDCAVQVYFCASETTDSQNNAVVIDEHVVPRPQGPREVIVRQV